MTFTDFLLQEGDNSIAADILKRAEDQVADEAADTDGKIHDEKIEAAALKMARKEKHGTAIMSIIRIKLGLAR